MHAIANLSILTTPERLIDSRPDHGKHRRRSWRGPVTWLLFLTFAVSVAVAALTVIPSGPHPTGTATVLGGHDRIDDPGARPGRYLAARGDR